MFLLTEFVLTERKQQIRFDLVSQLRQAAILLTIGYASRL